MRITRCHESVRAIAKRPVLSCAVIAIAFALAKPLRAAAATAPSSQQSVESLRLDLAMNFGSPTAHLALAKSLNEQGKSHCAFCVCENARALFGEDAFLASFQIVFRGPVSDILFHARKKLLEEAMVLQPQNSRLLKDLADLYAAHGDPQEAINALRRAMALAPDDFTLVESMQLDLTAIGNQADAKTLLDNWCQAHPDSAPTLERRIQAQLDQNDEAVGALLDQAIDKFPATSDSG